jgi:transglutaminase-like putative cysteine protease
MWHALKNLPREARDTVFLLVVIAWVIAPQAGNLPVWCTAIAATLLLWRGYLAVRCQALPSRWWLTALLILTTAATYFSHRTLMGQEAGVTFIVMLLSLKTLEMRTQRDAFVIFFLGFFTLLSNFFVSQSLPVAMAMLVGLLGLLTALVNSHMPVGRPSLFHAAKTAGWMALLGAPIMVVLFILFPRIAPLWGVPGDAPGARSGLSGSMRVGSIASLALDESIAMRVRFSGTPPRQNDLYFRGPVLTIFDGREWRPLQASPLPVAPLPADLTVQGTAVSYQVTLEPNNRPWIMVLDATPARPALSGYRAVMTPDLQWVADRPITELVRYSAQSHTSYRHGPQQMVTGLQDYLKLPVGFNPRTLQLATEMQRDPRFAGATSQTMIDAVLDRLRTGGYTYTLEPGVFGQHTADEFWFDRKTGFCEHIASSFVLLMRAMGIPARVVTGYQGGSVNPVDGFWTVRQSDAHAWAEVWIAAQGWVRVDPTSAVAPSRIGSLVRLEAPRNALTQALARVSPAFTVQLRALWDAANNSWNQWVLNYSQTRQLNLLRNLGFESPGWEDLATVLIILIVAASLVGAAWTLWERSRQDPWLRLLHRAAQHLRKAGLNVNDNTPPRQMAALLRQHLGDNHASLAELSDWLLHMEAWRYAPGSALGSAPGSAPQQLATLQRTFRHLPWPTAHRVPNP